MAVAAWPGYHFAAMSIAPNHPELRLALGYVPEAVRPALAALFALDEKFAGIVARTSEPTIGLMRLIWWRDALAALDSAPPPSEPLLVAAAGMRAHGLTGAALAVMTEGWEVLIDDPELGDNTVGAHASMRGAGLFSLAGTVLSARADEDARLALAGDGWARADLARHASDPVRAAWILASARSPLQRAMTGAWPRRLRPIAQLAVLASDDIRRGVGRWRTPGSPMRLLRILGLHTTGR